MFFRQRASQGASLSPCICAVFHVAILPWVRL